MSIVRIPTRQDAQHFRLYQECQIKNRDHSQCLGVEERDLCVCLSVGLSSSLSLSLSLSLRMSQRPAHEGHSGIVKKCVSCKGRQREGQNPEKSNGIERQGAHGDAERQRAPSPHRGSEPSPSPSPAAPSGFSDDTKAPLCPQVRRSTPLDLGMECRCRRMTSIP